MVQEIAKLLEQFFDVQVVQDEQGDFNETDLAPHKETILDKLATLNQQSLEGLITLLEEKTFVYTEGGNT